MKEQKMAGLMPSLKEKRRYVIFQTFSETPFTFEEIKEAITKEVASFLGRLGQAKAGVEFLTDWKEYKGIIRVATPHLDALKASLVMIRKINKREISIASIGVSGTLNKARTKFINGH